MATAIRNTIGVAFAPLGAFNTPIVTSNAQTIHIQATTGAQITDFSLDYNVPVAVSITNPFTGANPWFGQNVCIQVVSPVDASSNPLFTLDYFVKTANFPPNSGYTVSMGFDKTKPLMTAILTPPTSVQDITMYVTLYSSETPSATIKTIVYGN